MAELGVATQDEPDLQGRLGSITLTDILQLLGLAMQTGTLTLTQGWNGRTITYEDGRIVYITAVTPVADTTSLLIASGRISERQADAALLRKQREADQTIEEILLSMSLATEEDLEHCRNQQIEELLYTFFLWRECRFTFQSCVSSREGGLAIDLSNEHLILEGVRLVDEWIEISPIVPSIRMTFERTGMPIPSHLDETPRQVYEAVNGFADVASLARLCGITQYGCAKAIYELGMAGLVRAVPPNKMYTIQLFTRMVEGIYTKLGLFGYHADAQEFNRQLNAYSRQHGLKVRMRSGKVDLDDFYLPIDTPELIDRYRTFIAVQSNKFERMYPQEIVRGLVHGLYTHLPPELQQLMGVYDFVRIEGLFSQLRKPQRVRLSAS